MENIDSKKSKPEKYPLSEDGAFRLLDSGLDQVNNKNIQRQTNSLRKSSNSAVKEKGQYFIAFGVIATMLMVAGFPTFIVLFFGLFAFFLWKTFAAPSRGETRDIFEFYLSANDILRDDNRRWFGFEVQEVIKRGEQVMQLMNNAPPLVHFTLGALYQKAGDHQSAVNYLTYVVEDDSSDESAYAYPSPDLRNYVKVLRKIEREPHEAPLTSAAVRALERARRTRAQTMLETSRAMLAEQKRKKQELLEETGQNAFNFRPQNGLQETPTAVHEESEIPVGDFYYQRTENENQRADSPAKKQPPRENPHANRKPISEVLHDIYDNNNVQ